MSTKAAYIRNIAMYDTEQESLTGVTSVATLADDLIFIKGVNRIDDPGMFNACLALANEYINGDDLGRLDDLEEYVGIHLHTC